MEYVTKKGQLFWGNIADKNINVAEKTMSLVRVMDISEQKQAAEALLENVVALKLSLNELKCTQVQLIQAEKMSSLGQMIAGVAHEINNLVSFVYGNITHARNYLQDILGLIKLYQQTYPNPTSKI